MTSHPCSSRTSKVDIVSLYYLRAIKGHSTERTINVRRCKKNTKFINLHSGIFCSSDQPAVSSSGFKHLPFNPTTTNNQTRLFIFLNKLQTLAKFLRFFPPSLRFHLPPHDLKSGAVELLFNLLDAIVEYLHVLPLTLSVPTSSQRVSHSLVICRDALDTRL